jgi:hypothetical protein
LGQIITRNEFFHNFNKIEPHGNKKMPNTQSTITAVITVACSVGALVYWAKCVYPRHQDKGSKGEEKCTKKRARLPLSSFPPLQNDLLLRAAMGKPTERVPVWMMRQAGRYLPEYKQLRNDFTQFFEICRDPQLSMTASLQPLERFKTLDAVIFFSDILVIPQAMGMEVLMEKGRGPVFTKVRFLAFILA